MKTWKITNHDNGADLGEFEADTALAAYRILLQHWGYGNARRAAAAGYEWDAIASGLAVRLVVRSVGGELRSLVAAADVRGLRRSELLELSARCDALAALAREALGTDASCRGDVLARLAKEIGDVGSR